MRDFAKDVAAKFCTNLHQEVVMPFPKDFRQGEVKPRRRFRPCVHGYTETISTCLGTVNRHREGLLPFRLVSRVSVSAVHEDSVLNGDRMQLTRTRAYECHFAHLVGFFFDLESVVLPSGLPQSSHRRMKKLLPGMRANSVAEHCLIIPPF